MSKTARIKATAQVAVPQTRDQVVAAIGTIGRLQRECARIEADMNDQVAAIKTAHEERAKPLADQIKALTAGVQTWCEAHRADLTDGGKVKTANLSSGEVRWRMTPPSVSLKGVAELLKRLRDKGLDRFIRTKDEISKEAILAEPDAVKGVRGITIAQAEEFVIVPFAAELENA